MGKCSKDKRDVFYRLAKEEGFRARSAFKLLQINDQYPIFKGVTRAVDLCAAPGSWSQVLVQKLRDNGQTTSSNNPNNQPTEVKIISVDIQSMAPIEGVTMIQGDITSLDTAEKVIDEFKGCKAQLVVCDGAPDVTGQHDLDEYMQSQLLLAALYIITYILEENGTFVAKIFRGRDISLMIAQFRLFFGEVQVVKPKSSRMSSIEAFIVCQKFNLHPDYNPEDLNLLMKPKQTIDQDETLNCKNKERKSIVPFLVCGNLNAT